MHLLLEDPKNITALLGREIKLNPKEEIISRTDLHGNILFYNKNFAEISGYSRDELFHAPHSILRHPDMPKAIFYLLWQQLLAGTPTKAILKNFTKEGDYYWTTLSFKPLKDNLNNIISFIAYGRQTPQHIIDEVKPFYQNILAYEKKYDMYHAVKYLSDHLIEQNIASYNDYVHRITQKREATFLSSFKI